MADHDETSFAADFDPAAVRRSAVRVLALIGILVLVALLTPGLGELRDRLDDADLGGLRSRSCSKASPGSHTC